MNSIDEIIELYKKDIDVTLIDEALRLTPEERLRRLQEFNELCEELRSAMKKRRDPPR